MVKEKTSNVNAIAAEALAAIKKIDEKAKAEKLGQVEKIKTAKKNLTDRINELQDQQAELDKALAEITGKAVAVSGGRGNVDLADLRQRIVRLLQAHKDQDYSYAAILQQFPELGNRPFSVFMKAHLGNGKEIKKVAGTKGRGVKYQAA